MRKSYSYQKNMILSLKNFLLDILFPLQCLGCKKEGKILCESCKTTLPMLPPICIGCGRMTPDKPPLPAGHTCKRCKKETHISVFLSPLPYRHPLVNRLIHEYKYRRIRMLAGVFADLLTRYIASYRIVFPKQTLIIPIPLHPRKQRVRGFNQATLMAHELSIRFSLTIDTQTLTRITATPPQAMLTARLRRENVQHIFSARNTAALRGKNIILVDDVKTTGATLEQAAFVLKKAGAKQIWTVTIAH
ncbi:MAG: comF family protein [Parcubacteria group bacterium Gr01-1014_66]|nr:MAG: comF family protein [Parcubacteria group bacterium Gr01-1014_66]